MGQFMEALNNQTVLDDLGLTIDTFQGELPNVDEVSETGGRDSRGAVTHSGRFFQVIKHELSMDGSLDFNFPISTSQQQQQQQQLQQQQQQSNTNLSMEAGLLGSASVVSPAVAPQMQYPTPRTSVTTPSWVH